MSSIRYQKRGNKFYVYSVTQYWDKELKKNRQTTKYLGNAETEGGAYKKTGRRPAALKPEKAILDFGDSFAINEVAKNIGLDQVIKDSFEESSDSIMNLSCYQIVEGSSMQTCDDWVEGNIANKLFPEAKTTSQDISRLIEKLGKGELQQKFFRNYVAKFFPNKTGLLIDSTSLPSAINSTINAFGYTSDGIKENVTCLMLVDKDSKLPIYFRAVGGDISDNSTLQTTIKEIKQLGLNTGSAILDAGYCSKENLLYMCEENIDFVTRLPRSHNIFYKLIDDTKLEESHENASKYGDRVVFIKSKEMKIYGQKMFAHVILDPSKKAKDMNIILRDSFDAKHTEKQLTELNKKIKYSGFLILLSRSKIERQDVLPTYYTRQAIEQIFGFAKSNNNLLPLRVHSEQSINGYLMLVFISLILFITMRQKLQPGITMDKALIRLRGLKAKIYDNEILVQEPNKKVKDLARNLNIIMPTSLGV
ncbi:Transposase DDE domain protein [Candidatus Arcanobacter lacustris]|uniref:Transposase DDE domain protein n=1 Tax=Candidatus Arcanibacter lacustris TaxID=1607817 RepID=A0A0F5MPS3_9RICK|nr:Transposase DDE domain protein [Candidatus Arcanobacter lacustris]KKB96495.1 Transposase DDE domain protein [Candidatus Arcanobacter lacustris]